MIGERMARQHAPETDWSLDLLDVMPGDRVLELGCGAGRGLALAIDRAHAGSITGVDLSTTMLRAAARRNRAALRAGTLRLVRADISALPFAPASVDKVFSIHTFYFWPTQHDTLTDLVRLLAGGGKLVVTFATAETLPSGERVSWPLHERAEQLVRDLQRHDGLSATLQHGPDNRQYNNVALVIER
jgi:ubiquinone/menaquinone biosynthesis C-methylase UbiE